VSKTPKQRRRAEKKQRRADKTARDGVIVVCLNCGLAQPNTRWDGESGSGRATGCVRCGHLYARYADIPAEELLTYGRPAR
jgi:hypothetical protein